MAKCKVVKATPVPRSLLIASNESLREQVKALNERLLGADMYKDRAEPSRAESAACGNPFGPSVNLASPPKGPSGAIPELCETLSKFQDITKNLLGELTSRLQYVLGSSPPMATAQGKETGEICPMTGSLRAQIRTQDEINSWLRDLNDRLAL